MAIPCIIWAVAVAKMSIGTAPTGDLDGLVKVLNTLAYVDRPMSRYAGESGGEPRPYAQGRWRTFVSVSSVSGSEIRFAVNDCFIADDGWKNLPRERCTWTVHWATVKGIRLQPMFVGDPADFTVSLELYSGASARLGSQAVIEHDPSQLAWYGKDLYDGVSIRVSTQEAALEISNAFQRVCNRYGNPVHRRPRINVNGRATGSSLGSK